MVIGGESVYRQMLEFCDRVYITRILRTFDADAFFPNLDANADWICSEIEPILKEGTVRFRYMTYRRK